MFGSVQLFSWTQNSAVSVVRDRPGLIDDGVSVSSCELAWSSAGEYERHWQNVCWGSVQFLYSLRRHCATLASHVNWAIGLSARRR